MATLSRAESRHLYSWWWDSHSSPKNSKWLQENITDMDMKVKAMIKLIEEDADSFARRAEMYYKKRPELIKLVEEFYRAYRALAERYDHATGALRQAHRTMTEAFPNQIPPMLSDESPYGSSTSEVEPRTPEMVLPIRANFDSVDLHKDASGISSNTHLSKRSGAFSEETNLLSSTKGLKQLSEVSATADGAARKSVSEGNVQKGLNFHDDGEVFDTKSNKGSRELQQVKTKKGRSYVVENLQKEVSLLSTENQSLKSQVMGEFNRANRAENELQSIKDSISKLNSEKEADHLQYQSSLERISILEVQLSNTQNDLKKLNYEMVNEVQKLKDQKSKLEDEVGLHVREKEILDQELFQLKEDRHDLEKRYGDLMEQLKAVETTSRSLQAAIRELKETCKAHEAENKLLVEKLKDMDKISEKNVVLENSLSDANVELEILREKFSALENLHESLKCEKDALVSQVEILMQNVEVLSDKNTFLENSISDLNTEVEYLTSKLTDVEESCQSLNNQNSALLAEKNTLFARVESIIINLENLKSKFKELQDQRPSFSRERDLSVNQVKELQELLELQKQEDQALLRSYKAQIAALDNQISLLQEQNRLQEMELEVEKGHVIAATIETFVLQASLCDVHRSNLGLLLESQKHLEAHKTAEALVSQLKQEELGHLRNITSLTRRNEELCSKIRALSNTLHIDKDLQSVDGIQDEVLLDVVIVKIEKLLDCVSEAGFDIQQLQLEISVLVTLLKHIALDMANLKAENFSHELELGIKTEEILSLQDKQNELLQLNEKLVKNVDASNQTAEVLKAEVEVQCMQLINLQEALQKSESDILKLAEGNKSLSEELCNLKQKHNEFGDEHVEALAELMKLDNLYMFFNSVSAERLLELKSFSHDLISLHSVNDGLQSEVNRLNGKICLLEAEHLQLINSFTYLEEEFRNCLLNLEFDFNTIKIAFEDLDIESENMKNQLVQIDAQILKANQKAQFTQEKNMELHKLLESGYMELEEAKLVEEELRKRNFNLSETLAHRNKEVKSLHEANELLQNTIDKIYKEVELEYVALLSELQISAVHAAMYKEKVQELILGGEIHSLVEKLILTKEIGFVKYYMDELKKKLDDLEKENRGVMADMDAYLPLVTSLSNGIASLEVQIMSMPNVRPLTNHEKEEVSCESHQHHNVDQSIEDDRDNNIAGALELEKLIAKVEALGKVIIDSGVLLEQKMDFNSSLEATKREIEDLKTTAVAGQAKVQASKNPTPENGEDRDDTELSIDKDGQMMKDIQLDQVSNSLLHNGSLYDQFKSRNAETYDQLWEATEAVSNNRTPEAPSPATEHEIEAVKEEKSEYPSSELVVERMLSVDKLEISSIDLASERSWNDRILWSLESDARRLSDLKTSINKLKSKTDNSPMEKLPASFGYDTIKVQVKAAEVAVLELIDANRNLSKKTEQHSSSDVSDVKSKERRKVSEQVKREALKVGKLELELQKIQYVFMKLEEELESRSSKAAESRTRVLLRDYLYGRRESLTQMKKRPICWCIKPKTTGD